MIVGTVNGCFDVLHVAHIRFLEKVKSKCDKLIVLLNSDESVRGLKGDNRPINNEQDRKEMLLALKCVDEVIIFNESTPLNVLSKVKPNIHAKGGKFDVEKTKKERKIVESFGGQLIFLPLEEGYSSTNTIEKAKIIKKKS